MSGVSTAMPMSTLRLISTGSLPIVSSIVQSKLRDGMGLWIPLLALDRSTLLARMDADIDCPSEGKLFMNDGLIRMYRENSRQTGEFVLKKCDGFSLLGKIVNELYFVFEAKSSHQVYAITRTMTTNQRDGEQIDEDVDEEIQSIRNQESESPSSFVSFSPSPTPNGVSTDETVDDAILWHNRLTHRAISTLQKAGSVPKSVQ